MQKTPFAGLTRLNPNESLSTDGFSFQDKNVALIDYFIELALTHRHDGSPALADPFAAPSAAVDTSGGAIPADITLHIGYTLIDERGGESLISDTDIVSTEPPFDAPASAPGATVEYGIGSILIGTYYYGVTLLDAAGGESEMSPWTQVDRLPGDANARVHLSGLDDDFVDTGAVAWRLYRSKVGSHFDLLAEGTSDTYIDDGSVPVDCDVHPPSDSSNTTNSANKVTVVVPLGSAGVTPDAVSFNLYASLDGSFVSPCLVGNFDRALAGSDIEILSLGFLRGSPPDVSTSKGGLSKIDAETELLNFHWFAPVETTGDLPAGSRGDARLVLQASAVYGVLGTSAFGPGDWTDLSGTGGGGGGSLGIFGSAVGEGAAEVIAGVEWLALVDDMYPGQPLGMIEDAGGGSAFVHVRGHEPGANTMYVEADPGALPIATSAIGSAAGVEVTSIGFEVDWRHVWHIPIEVDIRFWGTFHHEDGLGGTGQVGLFLIPPGGGPAEPIASYGTGNAVQEEISLLDPVFYTLTNERIDTSDVPIPASRMIGNGITLLLDPSPDEVWFVVLLMWSDDGSAVFCEDAHVTVTPRPPW